MKPVLLLIFILIVFSLAVVLVKNFWSERKLSDLSLTPDIFSPLPSQTVAVTPIPLNTPGPDWRIFESNDKSFRFKYPAGWEVTEVILRPRERGVYGVTAQAWVLSNFKPGQNKNSLPPGAIEIDFEISTEGRKQALDNLIHCASGTESCLEQVINGTVFKRSMVEAGESRKSFNLATIKEDRIYRIIGTADKITNEEGLEKVEQIFKTFEVLSLS